jgi:light-harvesting protein B-800-850 alpha chain
MNQGTIWTVVKPTVGLPLLFGAVAVTALLVHFAVLTNTSWFAKFMNGKTAAIESSVSIG